VALRGGQRLVQRLGGGRDLGVARAAQERLPRLWLHRADLGLQLELDRKEARLLGMADQVALVEVEHRVVRRLDRRVDGLHALGQLGDAVARVAPEALPSLRTTEAVDRLEAREPAAHA